MTTATLILLSGGMDSAVLAAHYVNQGHMVHAISVDYGQRHRRELDAAAAVAARYGMPHDTLDLTGVGLLLTGSALTDASVAVPDGHYAEESMRATVVPNRNMIMLSAAVGVAVSRHCDRVATAVHAGDHFIYPDCRPAFIAALNLTATLANEGFAPAGFCVEAPFMHWTKAEIAQYGAALGVPFGATWSCYKGGELHCGTCGTCYERREAFRLAGVSDPTEYYDSTTEFVAS